MPETVHRIHRIEVRHEIKMCFGWNPRNYRNDTRNERWACLSDDFPVLDNWRTKRSNKTSEIQALSARLGTSRARVPKQNFVVEICGYWSMSMATRARQAQQEFVVLDVCFLDRLFDVDQIATRFPVATHFYRTKIVS